MASEFLVIRKRSAAAPSGACVDAPEWSASMRLPSFAQAFAVAHVGAAAAIAAVAIGASAQAHPPGGTADPHAAPAAAGSASSKTVDIQGGNDAKAWMADPHIHAFYDLSRATLGHGSAGVDVDAYEQKSFAIFREFGASRGMKPEAMQDHLKLIPRQMVKIAAEDPKVFDTYDNFTAALFGPP